MADPQKPVTEWDANGNPVSSAVTEWDANGNPVTGKFPAAPNAGLAPPPRPAFLGTSPTKEGSTVGQSPLIANAPAGNAAGTMLDTIKTAASDLGGMAKGIPASLSMALPTGDPRMIADQMDQRGKNVTSILNTSENEKKAGYSTPYRAASAAAQGVGVNVPGMEQSATEGSTGGVLGHAFAPLAALTAAEAISHAPGGASALRKALLPTTEEAGKLFQPIEAAAKNTPVDLSKVRQIAEEAQRSDAAGGGAPPVIKKFLKRTEPTPANFPFPAEPAEPMNYPEARLFAQNSGRLSATDKLAANAPMQRLVGQFAAALKEANRAAAEKVGMGAEYDQAMKQYAGAANRKALLENVKKVASDAVVKHAATAAGVGAGGAIAYKLLSDKK